MASIKLKGATSGEITISSPSVAGTNTLELQATSGTLATTAQASVGTKNLIINGNMQIAQRGTSSTGITTTGYSTVDRFQTAVVSAGTWTMTQDTDVPTGQGFATSLKINCTTAKASLTGTNQIALQTALEGQNLQQLSFGTANAKSITMSFWVKSNKTGTQTLEIISYNTFRSISKTYTVDTADTWEKKTITVDGDTGGTLIPNTNGLGFICKWWLGVGSYFNSGTLNTSWTDRVTANAVSPSNINLADSISNYINITGVQLEVGTTATPFENLMYSQQLAMCQRYYQKYGGGLNGSPPYQFFGVLTYENSSTAFGAIALKTSMRTQATVTYSGSFTVSSGTIGTLLNDTNQSGPDIGVIGWNLGSGGAAGNATYFRAYNSTATFISFSAEL